MEVPQYILDAIARNQPITIAQAVGEDSDKNLTYQGEGLFHVDGYMGDVAFGEDFVTLEDAIENYESIELPWREMTLAEEFATRYLALKREYKHAIDALKEALVNSHRIIPDGTRFYHNNDEFEVVGAYLETNENEIDVTKAYIVCLASSQACPGFNVHFTEEAIARILNMWEKNIDKHLDAEFE